MQRSVLRLYAVRSICLGVAVAIGCFAAEVAAQSGAASPSAPASTPVISAVPGMPPVVNPLNLYSETGAGHLAPAVDGALARVYVPNLQSNNVYVIDPATLKVVDRFKVGVNPQHIVPSWDLKTLWVTNNAEGRSDGSLTPIDPKTGKPGPAIAVDDPYNMYFTPDGKSAIVVAEALKRLDFRDPKTMALQSSIATPQCAGINHADFAIDGRLCDLHLRVRRQLSQDRYGQPQGCRLSQALEGTDAAGHSDFPRWSGVLCGRHDGRRRVCHRR